MKMISRHEILDRVAVGGMGPVALPVRAPPSTTNTGSTTHKYSLMAQRPTETFAGGTFRLALQKEFPISQTMVGAVLILKPGATRELHWHPNANEWQFYAKGTARMTIFDSRGGSQLVDFAAGDVGYVPLGDGHAIENTGTEDLMVILMLDSGEYEEISITNWLSQTLPAVLAANFGEPESISAGFPNENIFITNGKDG